MFRNNFLDNLIFVPRKTAAKVSNNLEKLEKRSR